jgi:hypothetical protein
LKQKDLAMGFTSEIALRRRRSAASLKREELDRVVEDAQVLSADDDRRPH